MNNQTPFCIAYSNCNLLASTECSFRFIAVKQAKYLDHHMKRLPSSIFGANSEDLTTTEVDSAVSHDTGCQAVLS